MDSLTSPRSVKRKTNKVVLHVIKRLIRGAEASREDSLPALRRAYTSLAACPISFARLEDLEQLKGFESAKVRLEISSAVHAWCSTHGYSMLFQDSVASDCGVTSGRERDTADRQATTSGEVSGKRQRMASEEDGQGDQQRATPPTKLYIPQARSGTYGILVALYALTPQRPSQGAEGQHRSILKETNDADKNVYYHSKATIISIAQPFCDSRYTPKAQAPYARGHGVHSFHSAWSGTKTLINKGYVYRVGNPARFGLSTTGWDVAGRCASRESGITAGCMATSDPGQHKRVDAQRHSTDSDAETNNAARSRTEETVATAEQTGRQINEEAKALLEEGLAMLKTDADYSAAARAVLPKISLYYDLVYGSPA